MASAHAEQSAGGPDPLMPSTRAVHHWTTTNLGEAAPGVLTPLCLALWGAPAERAARAAIHAVGVLADDELALPEDPADWILRPFHGRLAMQLELFASMGDRVPGTTGAEAIRSMFGETPPGMTFAPTRARYRSIAWRMPRSSIRFPAMVAALSTEIDGWWRDAVARAPSMTLDEARRLFADASARFERSSSLQLVGILASVQPLYDTVEKLIARAGVGDIAVLSGSGGAEMAVIADIWRASRGELEIDGVVARHGFHGPNEGELSSTVWREDDAPLRRLIDGYRTREEADSPLAAPRAHARELASMQAEVLAALPAARRPAARYVLKLAARRIPMRGVAKRSFLQAIDAARAAARRAGDRLAGEGVLADREDVFMLTGSELLGALPDEVRAVVAHRRERRAACEQIEFASTEWEGLPETIAASGGVAGAPGATRAAATNLITGTGVSNGVVEGVVRVVGDPSFADVEPDEILVAPTTDPSWSSIMFISAALVVDIGGALSHAAVVARELRIPCVVNTRSGTRVLQTGDRVRVDGGAGTVEVLTRAAGRKAPDAVGSPQPGG
jgi:pyruvate,water dikinase